MRPRRLLLLVLAAVASGGPAAASGGLDPGSEDELVASDGGAGDEYGRAVSGAGDVDADGYDDLVVGAWNAGSAYVYRGSAGGILAASEQRLSGGGSFGFAVSGAGDVDGDGHDDLLVGDHNSGDGVAYVYYGSTGGLAPDREDVLRASDAGETSTSGWVAFAYDLSGAGDLDGDGYDDVAVGTLSSKVAGSVYLYYGGADGIVTASESRLHATAVDAYDSSFGTGLSDAGDVNADGYGDLLVGADGDQGTAYASGAAYLYFGGAGGLVASSEQRILASDGAEYDYFGSSVDGAGDVNGDGFADVVVGASGNDGAAYVYLGGADGIASASELKLVATDPGTYDSFGYPVSGAGDVDADGYDDILIGAFRDDEGVSGSGLAWAWHGGPAGIDPAAAYKLVASDGARLDDYAHMGLDGAGDLDGDGAADVVIGARDHEENGAAYVYYGCEDVDADGACAREDCDDADARRYPGAAETDCDDPTDYNCDGSVGYADADGDGAVACEECDDRSAAIHPGAAEVCDAEDVDEDCDGLADDADPSASGQSIVHRDHDGDGYGEAAPSSFCDPPARYVAEDTDCDDDRPLVHPGADEPDCDTTDYDCDGAVGADDGDGDGVIACEDCDDGDAGVFPGAVEIADDGIDQDCTGSDAARASDSAEPGDRPAPIVGEPPARCGCATAAPNPALGLLLGLLIARRRR